MAWMGQQQWGHALLRLWAVLLSALLAALCLLALATRKHVVLWPGNGQWSPYGFSDQDSGGKSRTLAYRREGDTLVSEFQLSDAPARYGGLVLNSVDGLIRDCSRCSTLRLHYRTHTEDPLRVQILLDAPGRTHRGAELSRRYLFWELPPSRAWCTAEIPLAEFQTPEWWFRQNFVPPGQLPPPDYSRLLAVAVCESEFTPPWKPLGVELRSVVFEGAWWPAFLLGCLAPLPLLLQAGWARFRRTRVKPFGLPRPVLPRDEADFARITSLIALKYPEPELTLALVHQETRIPESRISQVLEKRTGLHFKPYLNRVRVEEAARLLRESDLTVSEIAFQVGYGNTTHFNRVFKSLKQASPGEYRRSLKGDT